MAHDIEQVTVDRRRGAHFRVVSHWWTIGSAMFGAIISGLGTAAILLRLVFSAGAITSGTEKDLRQVIADMEQQKSEQTTQNSIINNHGNRIAAMESAQTSQQQTIDRIDRKTDAIYTYLLGNKEVKK